MVRLAFAFLLSLCVSAHAQMSGGAMFPGPGVKAYSGGFSPGCTESSNWLTRLGSAPLYGLSSTTLRDAYDTMICGMVTDGDFAKLDALYIYATDTSTIAKLNLVSTSFSATYNGVPAESSQFAAGVGYTGNASNVFLSMGLNPNAGGLNYTSTSSSLGVYIPVSGTRTTGQGWAAIGQCDNGGTCGTVYHDVFPKFSDNNAYAQFAGNASAAMTNAMGLSIGIRTSATAMALWKNGSSVASTSSATGGLPNSTGGIYVLGRNSNNTINSASSDTVSAAFIGGGTIGVANISGRINTFMTSLGINAY